MPVDGCITIEGNSVQEAVTKALKALHISRDQAEIEVVSEGKQGFLGIGSKRAMVRVSIKEEAAAELELHDILLDLDLKDETLEEQRVVQEVNREIGLAEVKNGLLLIIDPTIEEGKFTSIKPGKHVRLEINGKEINEEAYVNEKDEIKIDIIHDEPESVLELTASKDNISAHIKLVREPGAKYKLKDQPKTNRLVLMTELEEMIELPPVSPEHVMDFLRKKNIVFGINEDVIEQVIDNPNSKESFLIAEGKKAVDGIDAQVRYPFLESKEDDEEEGLFGRNKLVSVTPGDIVAIKVPKQEGQDGLTIKGEPISAKVPQDCEIYIKNGCELVENGDVAVATIAGRPVTEISGNKTYVSVEPILIVKNVDQSTGNIKFTGDVEVKGDVREGYRIDADGNIEVLGDVTRATLRAGASVIIHKMVLGSTIIAGGRSAVYSAIFSNMKEIGHQLEKMFEVAQQLRDSTGFKTSDLQTKGDGPLIQLLIDSKFKDLSKLVSDMSNTVLNASFSVHDEVAEVVKLLTKSLCGLGPVHLSSIEFLQTLSKEVVKLLSFLDSSMKKVECIKARYVQNSNLLSTGDIFIEGEGSYISSMTAGGQVIIGGKPGVARGVKIVAHNNVSVNDLGSEFDTQTIVLIKGDGKISVELIHSNVILQIGNEKVRVDKAYKNLTAYINHEGRLTVDKLLAEEK